MKLKNTKNHGARNSFFVSRNDLRVSAIKSISTIISTVVWIQCEASSFSLFAGAFSESCKLLLPASCNRYLISWNAGSYKHISIALMLPQSTPEPHPVQLLHNPLSPRVIRCQWAMEHCLPTAASPDFSPHSEPLIFGIIRPPSCSRRRLSAATPHSIPGCATSPRRPHGAWGSPAVPPHSPVGSRMQSGQLLSSIPAFWSPACAW